MKEIRQAEAKVIKLDEKNKSYKSNEYYMYWQQDRAKN